MTAIKEQADDALSQAEAAGRRLGFLLAVSTLPDDIKDGLAEAIPQMSPEQQLELLEVFEAKYVDEKTSFIEESLKEQLQEAVKKYQTEDEQATKELLAVLRQI
jgi:uncharacterized protein YicC (UPF0701 family)